MQINDDVRLNKSGLVLTNDNVKKILDISSDFVNQTCYKLFDNTPVKYFGYYRYYDSGVMSAYVSNPELTLDLMHEDLMPSYQDIFTFQKNGVKSTFLSHNLSPPAGENAINLDKFHKIISRAADHGSYNALVIIDRFKDYFRYCIFAVNTSNKSIFNFYVNCFNQLSIFIKYFEGNCKDLLTNESIDNRIILPNYNISASDVCLSEFAMGTDGFNFLSESSSSDPLKNRLITAREKECMSLIAQGYTMKNAAKKLCISHRTVEQHLRNVKDKLGLNTKNQLVEAWHQYGGDDI